MAARQGSSAGDSRARAPSSAIGRGSRYLRSLGSMRILLKVLYWLAVLAISVALVIGLILWFEAQDASEIENSGGAVLPIMPA
jgi:cytochrome b subunit of formate dehydrogenase